MADDEFDLSDAEAYFEEVQNPTNTTSRLLQLPVEVLIYIIESGLLPTDPARRGLPHADRLYLQTLRGVHPQLAQLSFVRSKLFHVVRLTTDLDQLRSLERTGVGSAAPYVRRVIFKPTLLYRCDFPPGRERDSIQWIEASMKPRVERAVEGGRALKTWITVLEQLPKADCFHFTKSGSSSYNEIDCGPSGHVLLSLVLQALIASKRRICELTLEHRTEEEFVFTKMQEWEDLPLSALESLSFDFALETISRKWDYRRSFRLESAATLSHLLNASASRLRNLELSAKDDNLGALLDPKPPILPLLTSLHLSKGQINPDIFAHWITCVPSLQRITLDRIGLTSVGELDNWRPVFEALRRHPGNLLVTLESLGVLSAAGPFSHLSLRHQIPVTPKREVQCHPVMTEIADMMKMYLSGLAEWDEEDYWSLEHYAPTITGSVGWNDGGVNDLEGEYDETDTEDEMIPFANNAVDDDSDETTTDEEEIVLDNDTLHVPG